MPKVSVIVPVYKVEKYIHKCVESIIAQTLFDYLEVILVDDGSPDNCGKICNDYAEKYENIKVIHKENGGLSSARNSGLELCTGEFVCFIDSDDYVTPDYCETLYCLLKDTDYDYSVAGVCKYNDDEEPILENDSRIKTYTNLEFLEKQLDHETVFCVWNKMYRYSSIEKLRFMDGKLHEDLIWSADLASNCKNGVIETQKQCYYYRQRQGSIVANSRINCSPDFIYAGSHIMDTVKKLYPPMYLKAVEYTIRYPWSFVDRIYIDKAFSDNKQFLKETQNIIKDNINEINKLEGFSVIAKKRMKLFAKSMILYGVNAYSRLFRVYLYQVLKKDAQSDGHGI